MAASEHRADCAITILGPAASGKTTFLAALHTALIDEDAGLRLAGADYQSAAVLSQMTTSLASRGEFPKPTLGIEQLRWTLIGDLPWRKPRRRPFRAQTGVRPVRITLDIADSAGELTGPRSAGSTNRRDFIEHLTQSRGIIICFDPITEFATGDTFEHVVGLLDDLAVEMRELAGTRLPHHVAVCVTKFDDLRLLKTADALQILTPDLDRPEGNPRVSDEDAREFMNEICRLSASGTAELVPKLIEQTFYPDRIRYFVTSAIGFYIDPRTGVYNPDDQQNVVPGFNGYNASVPARVRGSIHPINVVEPVLWLASRISDERP